MLDLPLMSVEGHRTVDADEATKLGLPSAPHGLILIEDHDNSKWCLATADIDFYTTYLSTIGDAELTAVVLRTGGKTWRLIFDWPSSHIGTEPALPNPERD